MSRPKQSLKLSFLRMPAPASASVAPSDLHEVCALSLLSGYAHIPCAGKSPFFAMGFSQHGGTGSKVEIDGLGDLFQP